MTAVIPETPDQLEEAFNDEALMQNIFAEGNFGRFTHAYMKAFTGKSKEDIGAFKAQMQADFADFMRIQAERNGARPPEGWSPGDALAAAKGRGQRRARAAARYRGPLHGARDAAELFDRQGLFSPSAAGAAEEIDNSEYADSLRKFVWATLKAETVAGMNGDRDLLDKLTALKGGLARTLEVKNAGMAERVPSEGGFLVPETVRSEILSLSLEDEVMGPEATTIPMDSLRVPLPSIDDTSHTSSVFGGVAAYWTAEGAALTASAPAFSRLVLIANKLTAYTEIPNELLQDAVTSVDVWFNTFFPQAVAFFRDLAFLTGDGVDQPEGLINCPGAVTVDPQASYTATLIDVLTMLARLWPPSIKRARWVASNDMFAQLLQMGLVVTPYSGGSAGTAVPVAPPSMLGGMQAIEAPAGSAGDGFNYRMLGLPLRVSEKMPYPGSGQADGALTLYDPTGYLVGDRQMMQIASSAEYKFANDVVAYRVIERLDGRGWQRTALIPANGSSNKLSMIVKLGQSH
jgi:HK97 family phage major capsid protein